MNWFSKKKEVGVDNKNQDNSKKQEIKLPRLPELPEQKTNPEQLPPLPRMDSNKEMEMKAIKQDISPSPNNQNQQNHSFTPEIPKIKELDSHVIYPAIQTTPLAREAEPIFVKIDKFKEATNNFKAVKDKVNDIDNMLGKLRELKSKEEQELREWEHEIQMIKAKIDNIDNSLFKKV